MTDPDTLKVQEEVDRFFDEASRSGDAAPTLVLLMGPVAAGKPTLRKAR